MKRLIVISLLFLGFYANAQEDLDSLVVSDKIRVFSEETSAVIASFNPNFKASDVISKGSPLYVRSSAGAGLSTPSSRGLGASHTDIKIGDYSMLSPMNGNFNLSLLPAYFFENIDLNTDGEVGLMRAPNMGGSIHFKSKLTDEKSLFISGASFGHRGAGFKFGHSFNRFRTKTSAIYTRGINNFSLKNYPDQDGINDKAHNGRFYNGSIMNQIEFSLKNSIEIGTQILFLQQDAGIIGYRSNMLFNRQADRNTRISIHAKKNVGFFRLKMFGQAWQEDIDFYNKVQGWSFKSKAQTLGGGAHITYGGFKHWGLETGVLLNATKVKGDNFENNVKLNRNFWSNGVYFSKSGLKAFLKHSFLLEDIKRSQALNINLQKNMKWLGIFLDASKVYRLPTLNDLYWNEPPFAQGNELLEPEEGYKVSIGGNVKLKNGPILQFKVHSGWFSNLIWWTNSSWFTSPVNLPKVWTRGFEGEAKFAAKKTNSWATLGYQFTLSTDEYQRNQNDLTYKKDLIYSPRHQVNAMIYQKIKNVDFYLNSKIIGPRFTRSDNTKELGIVTLFGLGMRSQILELMNKWPISIAINLDNLLNQPYFLIDAQPMPGFNGNLTLDIKI